MKSRKEILEKYAEWSTKLGTEDIFEKLNEIIKELSEDTEDKVIFLNFLANLFPIMLISNTTSKEFRNVLEFNHFANKVIFEEQNL